MTASETEEFVRLLTEVQPRLFAYILVLLPDRDRAKDVLQETNLVLWRKSAEFSPGSNFGAWAAKVAYFQVLAYRRRYAKDRHVFDPALLEDVAAESVPILEEDDDRQRFLMRCLERLRPPDRELIHRRYAAGASVKQMAEKGHSSAAALCQRLYRIRAALVNCVEEKLVAKRLANAVKKA